MAVDAARIQQEIWLQAGKLLGFSPEELATDLTNFTAWSDLVTAATLAARRRHVEALEALLAEHQTIAAHHVLIATATEGLLEQETAQTPLVERIAVSNEGQWDCCRYGSERSEALLDVTMNHPDAPPQEKWERYEDLITGGGNVGGSQAG